MEVKSQKDIEAFESCEFDKIGLVIERPKEIYPCVIIYDVEREYKEEDLKEDVIMKYHEIISDSEDEIKKTVKFLHNFKARDEGQINWIIQLPEKYQKMLTAKGREFLLCRSYGIREHMNVTKCYKCDGRLAKVCSSQSQLGSMCGSNDHLRKDYPKKDNSVCLNCLRTKRKDTTHAVHSQNCPEYQRHLELYLNRINVS